MTSTWGILQGLSESSSAAPSYIGIDIETPSGIRSAKYLAEACGISFKFLNCNDMTIDIEPTEMLFIDSLHTYCHLLYELEKFSPKVSKYIALHDTNAPWGFADDYFYKGDYTEYPAEFDRSKRGLWQAVEDFLLKHSEWVIMEHHFHNYGFTILKRKSNPQI
jgi:cephalosporin hydroxylase